MSHYSQLAASRAVRPPALIAKARERMLSGINMPDGAVRPIIEASWQRCLSEKVDPTSARRAGEALTPDTLSVQYEELICASEVIMREAHALLSESGTIMHLVSPSGIILRCEGDPSTLDLANRFWLTSGANWTEDAAGTNAIGTALSIDAPVQVHAHEHFCEDLACWTCSAAIIHDPFERTVLGAVNISGLHDTRSDYCLALALSGAKRIEGQLAQLRLTKRDRLLSLMLDRLARTGNDGVLLFDTEGHLLRCNALASRALAAQGISAELNPDNPVARFGHREQIATAPSLLTRLNPSWVEPVIDGQTRIGFLAVVPLPQRAIPTPAAPVQTKTGAPQGFSNLLGQDPAFRATVEQAQRLARAPIPILLQGETGVGKELFAHAIHSASSYRDGEFVALNCGGLSRDLLAGELFGHIEGAFTGARKGGMQGKIEAANGGTLFLDEIGEMPLDLQPMFLRVLQEQEICRIGENRPRRVNFRLVAATNRDLRAEVAEGRFRMDLYYRVSSTSLTIPPLRERRKDIPLLAQRLLEQLASRYDEPNKRLSPELVATLQSHDWPGNVRELTNALTSAFFLSEGPLIGLHDLSEEFFKMLGDAAAAAEQESPLEHAEREMILLAIREQKGNLTQVARQLQIAKSTLYAKLKKYAIER